MCGPRSLSSAPTWHVMWLPSPPPLPPPPPCLSRLRSCHPALLAASATRATRTLAAHHCLTTHTRQHLIPTRQPFSLAVPLHWSPTTTQEQTSSSARLAAWMALRGTSACPPALWRPSCSPASLLWTRMAWRRAAAAESLPARPTPACCASRCTRWR